MIKDVIALISASLLAIALAAPASAGATTATVSGTELSVTAEPGEANDIILSYVYDSGYKYLVFEQGDGLDVTSPDASCVPYKSSIPAVSCVDASLTTGVLKLGKGGDVVCPCGAIPVTMSLTILGGKGGDELTGGQAPEVMKGGKGKDVIMSDSGIQDELIGGPDADKFIGSNYGPDLINAKDGERDKLIDCGDGPDPKPKYDHRLDPKPIRC